MIEVLHVWIPTRGRIHQQTSMKRVHLESLYYNRLPNWLQIHFIVPESEKVAFVATHPWVRPICVVVPDSYRFGSVCQAIAEQSSGYTLLLDDDMWLYKRKSPLDIHLRTGNKQDAWDFFMQIRHWLRKGYAHGGVSLRQTNRFWPKDIQHADPKEAVYHANTRVCGVTFFDSRVLKTEGIRFDAVQARSDFHVYLSLLELGYHNVCEYEFACGQTSLGSNAPGGCSLYRTPEFLIEQALLLRSLHPGLVTLVYKQRVMKAARMMVTEQGIPDVRISWAKALGNRVQDRQGHFEKIMES